MNLETENATEAFDGLSCQTGMESAHASAIRRLIKESPPFRPEASAGYLVAEFANGKNRLAAFLALYSRGVKALPAVREGLKHANWQIRRWCAMFADHFADGATLYALTPLLRDPKAEVRVWAVHSLACEVCKEGPNPIDTIPLLLERIEGDPSLKVRRQAVAMLAHHRTPDTRVLPVFKRVLSEDCDRKLRLHAEQGLERCAASGLSA